MGRLRCSVLLGGGIAAAVVLTGCGDANSARDESAAEIYTAAIRWMVADDAGDDNVSTQGRVFVEAAGEERIPLSVQAEVVNRLEDAMEVRFIDTREEAIDTSEPADPVRDEGVLIGLGHLRDLERASVRLYADRYRDLRDVVAYEVVLDRRNGRWQVTGNPSRVAVDDANRALRD